MLSSSDFTYYNFRLHLIRHRRSEALNGLPACPHLIGHR